MRTDQHSPTNFDPALYEYVGSFDNHAGYEPDSPMAIERLRLRNLLEHEGMPGGNWQTKEYCDHCGAWNLRYICVFRHVSGQHIATGEICAEEAFGHVDRMSYEVDRLRKAAAAERERIQREEEVNAFFEANEDLRETLSFPMADGTHYIISDIAHKLRQYGSLSDKQIALVRKLKAEAEERKIAEASRVEEIKIPAPTGRVSFVGKVVAIKEQWSNYAGYQGGYINKLVIKVPAGYTVWVTQPSSLINLEVGETVAMTATLKRSDRDESFAFGSRPSKSVVIEIPEEGQSSLD